MGAVGIAATALTALALLLTLRTWRRETRVRVWLDGTRLIITGGSITGMMLVLGVATPIWLGLAGGAVGLLLGAGQGRGLQVRWTERGGVARRTLLGLLAAGLGIVVVQTAATLNRAGIVRMGLAVSFVSLGITAGLIWGRRRPMRVARSAPGRAAAAAGVVAVLAAGLLSVGAPQARSQTLSCPASVGELNLRPPVTEELEARAEAGKNDPLRPAIVCSYWPPSDLLGVVSTATIAVRWHTERIPGEGATGACGNEDSRADFGGSGFTQYHYSPVATALVSYRVTSRDLRYDETALDIAARALLEQAEFLAASCEPDPPGGRFANRGPIPIPGFANAAPDGVVELTGGIIDTLGYLGGNAAAFAAMGMNGVARNEATVRIAAAGGPIEGVGIFVTRWDGAPLDIALHEAFVGPDPGYVPKPCFYLEALTYELTGTYDATSGALTGEFAGSVLPTTVISGCEDTGFGLADPVPTVSFDGVFDGTEATIRTTTDGGSTSIPAIVVVRVDGVSSDELGVSIGDSDFTGEEALLGGAGSLAGGIAIPDVSDEDVDFFTELFADDVEISEEDAATAALLGLLGISALAISGLLEAGIGIKDLIESATDLEAAEAAARAAAAAAATPPVILDENGDPLTVNDGRYDAPVGSVWWGVDEGGRWVSRDEAGRLVEQAIASDAALAAEKAEALDRHMARIDGDFQTLIATVRDQTARFRAPEVDTTKDLREHFAGLGLDDLVDYLERNPMPDTDELWRVLEAAERQINEQAALDALAARSQSTWDQMISGSQRDLAQLLDELGQPHLGWLVREGGWKLRMGAALATGGMSEGLAIPMQIIDDLDAAQQRSVRNRGQMLSSGELAGRFGTSAVREALFEAGGRYLASGLGQLFKGPLKRAADASGSALRAFEEAVGGGGRWLGEGAETALRQGDEAFEAGSRSLDDVPRYRDHFDQPLSPRHVDPGDPRYVAPGTSADELVSQPSDWSKPIKPVIPEEGIPTRPPDPEPQGFESGGIDEIGSVPRGDVPKWVGPDDPLVGGRRVSPDVEPNVGPMSADDLPSHPDWLGDIDMGAPRFDGDIPGSPRPAPTRPLGDPQTVPTSVPETPPPVRPEDIPYRPDVDNLPPEPGGLDDVFEPGGARTLHRPPSRSGVDEPAASTASASETPRADPDASAPAPDADVPRDQELMEQVLQGENPPGAAAADEATLIMDDPVQGTSHAGEGGWSPEALRRRERFWNADGSPKIGPDAIDTPPPPNGFDVQMNPDTRVATPRLGSDLTAAERRRLLAPGGPVEEAIDRINRALDEAAGTP